MDKVYRALSVLLLAIVVIVIGLQSQISALIPAGYAVIFGILILVLREFVKAKGQAIKNSFVMDKKYRIFSLILMCFALVLISVEPTLKGYVPQDLSFLFAILMLIVREAVKEKGLNLTEVVDEIGEELSGSDKVASPAGETTTTPTSDVEDEADKLEEDGA